MNANEKRGARSWKWLQGAAMVQAIGVFIAGALYWAYLSNAMIFDDLGNFISHNGSEFAMRPISLAPRTFPYFTLSFVHVLFGTIEAQRVISLVLHLATGIALAGFLQRVLAFEEGVPLDVYSKSSMQRAVSVLVATAFLVHPLAVYGAAYLIERTIVLATLFTLLSLNFYLDAVKVNSTRQAAFAGLLYAMAVMSKEHAIMALPAALALTLLAAPDWRTRWRPIVVFASVGLPVMLWVAAYSGGLLGSLRVVGAVYEPLADIASNRLGEGVLPATHPWIFSAGLQCELFYRYVYLWLTGDISRMAIDARVDFRHISDAKDVLFRVLLFVLPMLLIALPAVRKRVGKAVCIGVIYLTLMFLVELSTVRLQEPFVLYRAYLWAPGVALIVGGISLRFTSIAAIGLLVAAVPWFCYGAIDRLDSLRSEESVWEDAASKLADTSLPGSERVLFHRGGYLAKHGNLVEGLSYMDKVVSLQPNWWRGYMGRALVLLKMGRLPEALSDADVAVKLAPASNDLRGLVYFNRAKVLEKLGRRTNAVDDLRVAAGAGNLTASFMLQQFAAGSP